MSLATLAIIGVAFLILRNKEVKAIAPSNGVQKIISDTPLTTDELVRAVSSAPSSVSVIRVETPTVNQEVDVDKVNNIVQTQGKTVQEAIEESTQEVLSAILPTDIVPTELQIFQANSVELLNSYRRNYRAAFSNNEITSIEFQKLEDAYTTRLDALQAGLSDPAFIEATTKLLSIEEFLSINSLDTLAMHKADLDDAFAKGFIDSRTYKPLADAYVTRYFELLSIQPPAEITPVDFSGVGPTIPFGVPPDIWIAEQVEGGGAVPIAAIESLRDQVAGIPVNGLIFKITKQWVVNEYL